MGPSLLVVVSATPLHGCYRVRVCTLPSFHGLGWDLLQRFLTTAHAAAVLRKACNDLTPCSPRLPICLALRLGTVAEARVGDLGPLDKHDLPAIRGANGVSRVALQLEAGALWPQRVPGGNSTKRRGFAKREGARRVDHCHLECLAVSVFVGASIG